MIYYYARNKFTGETVKGFNRDVPFYETEKGLKVAINQKVKLNHRYDKQNKDNETYPKTKDGYSIHSVEI